MRALRVPKLTLAAAVCFVLPAAAGASMVTVQSEQTVVTKAQRSAAGLNAWPDTPMGVEKTGTGGQAYTFYAANNDNVARTVGSLDNPIAVTDPADSSIVVQGARQQVADLGYAAGGPIYTTTYQGQSLKLMFVHLEQFPDGNPADGRYGSIGLAKASDALSQGTSWQFLGQIFQENRTYQDFEDQEGSGTFCGGSPNTAVGEGEYVIRNEGGVDYFYVYTPDWQFSQAAGCQATFAVERAPVSAVVAAAANGTVSPWSKFYAGGWNESGIGGRSSDVLCLLPGQSCNGHFRSFSVSYNSYVGRYIMLQSVFLNGTQNHQGLSFRESCDGVYWSDPTTLPFDDLGEIYNPTIVGIGNDPRTTDHNFYVYYSYSLGAVLGQSRWDDASLRRRPLSIFPSGGCPGPV